VAKTATKVKTQALILFQEILNETELSTAARPDSMKDIADLNCQQSQCKSCIFFNLMFTSNRAFTLLYNRCMKVRYECIHCSFINYGLNMLFCTAIRMFQFKSPLARSSTTEEN
jgi:hypothetical protein